MSSTLDEVRGFRRCPWEFSNTAHFPANLEVFVNTAENLLPFLIQRCRGDPWLSCLLGSDSISGILLVFQCNGCSDELSFTSLVLKFVSRSAIPFCLSQ